MRSRSRSRIVLLTPLGQPLSPRYPGLPPTRRRGAGKSPGGGQTAPRVREVQNGSGRCVRADHRHEQVSDRTLERFLAKFLPKYPGIRQITVAVDDGVVTLEGQVEDDDTSDEVTDVVKRVEGVRLVMNQMKTDDEMMTAWEFAAGDLRAIATYFARNGFWSSWPWRPRGLLGVLARLFATRSETILARSSATCCCGRWPAP